MDALDFLGRGAATFILKFTMYAFVALVLIFFFRIGYCYLAAEASVSGILPQIARFVAEDNGLVTDATVDGTTYSDVPYDIVADILNSCNKVPYTTVDDSGASVTGTRDNAAFHYYVPDSTDFEGNTSTISNHTPAITVKKVDSGQASGDNRCLKTTDPGSGNGSSVVQRGDILEIQLTVYATVFPKTKSATSTSAYSIFSNVEIPITKTMRVPAVKYYRGYS